MNLVTGNGVADQLIGREDARFEEACHAGIFNGRKPSERTPAAVLVARTEQDVVDGVRLANERGWRVSVRSGGHDAAGQSVNDGGLLIDLAGLSDKAFDAQTGIATAGAAVRGGRQLAPFLAEQGRTFTGGHCADVGLGGYLTLGGQGWNSRRWGWACENVLAVDVVTADGQLVHASATENEDLYWAARGSGAGFFGVVTRFHLRTYRWMPMFHDTHMFAFDQLEAVLQWLHEVLPTLDVAVEPFIIATRLRTGDIELLLHTTLVAETMVEADRLFAPLDALPVEHLFGDRGPTTLALEHAAQQEQSPENLRYTSDNQWTNASAAEIAPFLRDLWQDLPGRHSFSTWCGWAPSRPLQDMAFGLEANVLLATYASWSDPAEDERHRAWLHGHYGRIATAVGVGTYLGDTDYARRPDRFTTDEKFGKLARIRADRDPDGRFSSYLGAVG